MVFSSNRNEVIMNYTKILFEQINPNVWDGGKTYEYFIYPKNSNYNLRNFDFRISSATIEKTPAIFTKFQSYTRYLVMLDTNLILNYNSSEIKIQKNEIFKFSSTSDISSYSEGNDFNVMLSDRIKDHHLTLVHGTYSSYKTWVILFALQPTKLIINKKNHFLKEKELLVFENFNHEKIEIISECQFLTLEINIK